MENSTQPMDEAQPTRRAAEVLDLWKRRLEADKRDEKRFNDALCKRMKSLRDARGLTQEQMAAALGIGNERYRKYENRSPLPLYLVGRFCEICGCSIGDLIDDLPTS